MPAETIQLDRRHRVQRDEDVWMLEASRNDGGHEVIDVWKGNRRSLMRMLEHYGIHPTREAEAKLAAMPERAAFGPDRD